MCRNVRIFKTLLLQCYDMLRSPNNRRNVYFTDLTTCDYGHIVYVIKDLLSSQDPIIVLSCTYVMLLLINSFGEKDMNM